MSQLTLKILGCVAAVVGLSPLASAATVSYAASTGQTATATFSFADAMTLQIILTETSPAGLTFSDPSDALLTGIGVKLAPANFDDAGSSVNINAGSSPLNFTLVGTDVSGEWGVTDGIEASLNSTGNLDFISANEAHVTRLAGANLHGPDNLNGPEGGLVDDASDAGGVAAVDNSVIMLIKLDTTLTAAQQVAFLGSVGTVGGGNSVVEWGSSGAFGHVVPLPAAAWMGIALFSSIGGARYLRRRRQLA